MTSPVIPRSEKLAEYHEELRGLACSLAEPHTPTYRRFVNERAHLILDDLFEGDPPDARALAHGLAVLTEPRA